MSTRIFRKLVQQKLNLKNVQNFKNGSRPISVSTNLRKVENGIITFDDGDVEIPKKTIPEYVFERIENYTKYTSIECSITGRKYTYGEIRTKCRNLAKSLRKKLKLQKHDVVALYIPNIPDFPIAALGCLEAGLVITTINSLYMPDEIARQLKDSNAKAIITVYELYDNILKGTEKLQKKLPIVCIRAMPNQDLPNGAINFEEWANEKIYIPDFEFGSSEDVAFLPYSSGTTGMPKGVELTHSNIIANLAQMGHPSINFFQPPSESYQEVSPSVLPFFHIYGFTATVLNFLVNGIKSVTLPKFIPELYINTLKNQNVTVIFAAPPLVLFMSDHPAVKPEFFNHLKVVMSGAAPLGALDEERFRSKAGKNVYMLQGYGLTETSPVVSMTSSKLRDKYQHHTDGSIGQPVPNTQVKIVKVDDPQGTPLGPNESGELLVKGPQVMKGYHNKPEATQEMFLNGWLRTGDLSHYNERGLIYITDRVKELIKVKGFQVAPAELEELLRDYPGVTDAAVIGISHKDYGEVPRAYIVLKDKEIEVKALHEFLNEKVASYKRIQGGIEFVKEIPKNSAGKILRRQLKLKFESENKK